ncbi:MAG TPA: elongation factor G-like protein EF-G2 [Actinomycetales bacterium]|nr:elongation factor G-like protein EF-G2 [Actinomycetales bacterium]
MPGKQSVRNVVLVGHPGGGKTTLAEAVLARTGAVARQGRVDDGTTVTDHEDIEKHLKRSVCLAVADAVVADDDLAAGTAGDPVRITLLDTPGHPDFVGELRAGLRAADAALFVVSAVDGISAATRLVWEECAAVGMPRAVVVTHVDQPRGDFEAVVEICQRLFGEGCQALYLPVHADDDSPAGLIGLLTGTLHEYADGARSARPAEAQHLEATSSRRAALVEGIIAESEDETLLDRYLGGEDVDEATLVDDLETAVARGSFHPVLPCVPTSGLGVAEVVELLVRGFPAPAEHRLPPVTTPAGEPREALSCDAAGPLVAEVVRTTTDPYVGRVSLVRVFSGTLTPDSPVHVSGHLVARPAGHEDWHPDHDVDERVGALMRLQGATGTAVPRAVAGDVVAVARLRHAETGDTLSDPEDPALLEPWVLPDPLLPVAVAPRTTSEESRMADGLARLQAEDPTVRLEVDPDTHQVVLWTMGEAHRDVLLERLSTRSGVEVVTSPVRVAVRETFAGTASGHGRHVKQSGGHGQYAVVDLEVEPLPEGSGFEFVDAVTGGAVPRQYIPAVEKGARARLARGLSAGYPVVDVRVRLLGGKAHSVDSSEAAFATAAGLALEDAARAAGITLLEPLDVVTTVVDDEFLGAVLADLSGRRARVTGTQPVGSGRTSVDAEVPAFELTRYAADLRGLGHGTGSFVREYARHSPAPTHVAARLAEVS